MNHKITVYVRITPHFSKEYIPACECSWMGEPTYSIEFAVRQGEDFHLRLVNDRWEGWDWPMDAMQDGGEWED